MTTSDSPSNATRFSDIPELIAGMRRLPADRPALSFYKGRTRAGRQSYGELLYAVERTTSRLRDQLGLRRGDRIAILAPNRLEVPALLLGAMRLGVAVVPLNPTTGPADWDYILGHSEARAIFGDRDLLGRVGSPPPIVCPFEDEPPAGPVGEDAEAVTADGTSLASTMAVVLYTSGTTGNPKGVASRTPGAWPSTSASTERRSSRSSPSTTPTPSASGS